MPIYIAVIIADEGRIKRIVDNEENRNLLNELEKERRDNAGTGSYPLHDRLEELLDEVDYEDDDSIVPCNACYFYNGEF